MNFRDSSVSRVSYFDEAPVDEKFFAVRVHGRMGPRTNLEVLSWATGNNEDDSELFFFTVVRNPFDRLLSTYRDRILKVCSPSIVDPIIGFFRGSKRDLT